ncbi:ChbG/HpnK family deacetylase [Vagococcus fluvialis]|uniref:ChbG/HpnK family deacetylase n=1 Tax=Vagococcus fluvialis TaxID=2738 RepID=UPI003D09EF4A
MKLIMRADDLGFSEAVNYGIEKAVKSGLITSVGLMSNMEAASHGYKLLENENVAIGLHTNISNGKPISSVNLIPSLVDTDGYLYSSKKIRNRQVDEVDVLQCQVEIEAQVNRFYEISGKYPDYIDVHAVGSNNFFEAVYTISKKLNIPCYVPNFNNDLLYEDKLVNAPMFNMDSNGLYDPKEYFEDVISKLNKNSVNVCIFHPGYLDEYILKNSSFTLIRPMETEFLCSDWLKNWINEHEISLLSLKK